jgi:hypothetical protein
MASDEYHEAILERVHLIQREIRGLSQRDALSYAYLLSREMPEEAVRMLVAELLMDDWSRSRPTRLRAGRPTGATVSKS